jgi:twinkle protein
MLHQGPCPDCGSSDACATYDDLHTHCYACEKTTQPEKAAESKPARTRKRRGAMLDTDELSFDGLAKRKITAETMRIWGYGIAEFKGEDVHVAQYRDKHGERVAQKIRTADKGFVILGDSKAQGQLPFGIWRCKEGGRRLVVVEGELDALSWSQIQGNRWDVVSVPNGASSAERMVKANLAFFESYTEVVLMMDADAPGQKAALEIAELLSPGKASIVVMPEGVKDPSDALQQGKAGELTSAFWDAKTYRPDGILTVCEIEDRIRDSSGRIPIAEPLTPDLFKKTRHMMPGQLWTICAGSGMGKTEYMREIGYYLVGCGLRVGHVPLEESSERTLVGYAGLHMNERLDLWDERNEDGSFKSPLDHPRWAEAHDFFDSKLEIYDGWGSVGEGTILSNMRYLRVGLGVDVIILDHLSILVSDDMGDDDERKLIDRVMTRLRAFAEETGVLLIIASHLKRPHGTPHEEGGRTSLGQLRGSASIGQLSDIVIGLERNQQADDGTEHVTTIRILKNRRTGRTGIAGYMAYDDETGRMLPLVDCPFDEEPTRKTLPQAF